MSAMDLESSNTSSKSGDAGERAPSPPPATVVGLGPPDPPLAASTSYEASETRASLEKQTLVGFPGPAPDEEPDLQLPLDALALADSADDDEVTVVGGYDEVTVVTPSSPAIARLLSDAKPLTPAVSELETDPSPEAAFDAPTYAGFAGPPPDMLLDPPADNLRVSAGAPATEAPRETADDPAEPLDDAEVVAAPAGARDASADTLPAAALVAKQDQAMLASLVRPSRPPPPPRPSQVPSRPETVPPPSSDRDLFVSRDTELQLFAPPVEMFGPGFGARGRFDTMPPQSPSPAVLQSDAPWYTPVENESTAARRPRARPFVIGAVIAAVATVGLASGVFLPKTARVLVTASGPLDAPIANATVFVDGKRTCAPAPCRVTVPRGAYVLSVSAPSYRHSADKSLSVSGGAEEAIHFTLQPDDSAGVEIKSDVAGLRVFIDGLDRGTTPLSVRGLSPGKHGLKLLGSSRYVPLETELELPADRVFVFEPKLEPVPEPVAVAVDDLARSPRANEVAPATAPATPATAALPWLRAHVPATAPVAAANVDLDTPEAKATSESVTLSVRSSPPSNVVVDGRPLGSTPREVAVTPGDHSVVFVHPSKGRKSVRVRATAGKPAVASVDF